MDLVFAKTSPKRSFSMTKTSVLFLFSRKQGLYIPAVVVSAQLQPVLTLDLRLLQQAVLPCMFLSHSGVSAVPSRVCVSVHHQYVLC